MFLTNLKIAWRQLRKNRSFGIINLLGLALGLAAALAVVLYIQDELAYERFHEHADRIVRVNLEADFDGELWRIDAVPNATASFIEEYIPEVEQAVRVFPHKYGESAFIRAGENNFVEDRFFWADPDLFEVFSIPLQSGSPAEVLKRVNTVILSAATAKRYFGQENPVGKTIKVDNRYDLEVTGVFEDLPANTHLPFQAIASFHTLPNGKAERHSWGNASFLTFLLLNAQADPVEVEGKIAAAMPQAIPEDRRWFELKLKPLLDVHLYSEGMAVSSEAYGDITQVRILAGLALLLLLTACVNYMNLSTARSQKRSKEVGVSKTMGASSWSVARQFYVETALLSLAGISLSILLLRLALPYFNQLSGKELSIAFLGQSWFWLIALAVWLFVTFIAGAYPAAYLSSFMPLDALRQSFRARSGAGMVRQGLVVFQFCISTALIISTLVFYRQLQYIQHKKLGYQPEQVVALRIGGLENQRQKESLEKELQQLAPVLHTSISQSFPGQFASGYSLHRPNAPEEEEGAELNACRAHPEVFETLGISFLAGKPMRRVAEGDSVVQLVLNESAVKYLGYTPAEAVGQRVDAGMGPSEISGVVEDFHFGSLHEEIGFYAFHNRRDGWLQFLLVKLKSDQILDAMSQIQTVFKKAAPATAFDYTFLDDHLASLYETESRLAKVIMLFAGLAIFVACLGLFALVAFTAEQRTKEIGVRKVLGATVTSIVALLSKDFLKLVFWSILIAAPLTWWAMNRWLQNFAYRIELQWPLFALAGLVAVLIALLTVSFQSVKAALSNPIDALRDE